MCSLQLHAFTFNYLTWNPTQHNLNPNKWWKFQLIYTTKTSLKQSKKKFLSPISIISTAWLLFCLASLILTVECHLLKFKTLQKQMFNLNIFFSAKFLPIIFCIISVNYFLYYFCLLFLCIISVDAAVLTGWFPGSQYHCGLFNIIPCTTVKASDGAAKMFILAAKTCGQWNERIQTEDHTAEGCANTDTAEILEKYLRYWRIQGILMK